MPATLRNVAKTDTLETQRQKINEIAQDVYNIAAGGSDLATGNLKLGDGTRTTPSLAFTSDETLGIYKPANNTFGFVSGSKKIADFSNTGVYSFKDLIIRRNILTTAGTSILNRGTNYDPGNYSNVSLVGGTGEGATASVTVIPYNGTITNTGTNYNQGSYSSIPLLGGSGSGSTCSFTVNGIQGFISDSGSGYIPGSYANVSLTGGSGSGAKANLVISGETQLSGVITNSGSGYTTGQYSPVSFLNQATETFVVATISNPGTPPPDNVYTINGNTQQILSLVKGNTYRFDVSDSSNAGHPFGFQTLSEDQLSSEHYVIISRGFPGSANSFIDLIIKPSAPTETIRYFCSSHAGMGANISISSGSVGNYGSGISGSLTVNSSNQVSDVLITSAGNGYKENDTLQVYSLDVGGTGSDFLFTLSAPVYSGQVTSVSIVDNGTDYINNDILSINSSSIGGFGSDFSFTINNNPNIIDDINIISYGNSYEVDDVLTLPQSISNIATTLKGVVSGVSTTLSDSSDIITVADTTGILPGMIVSQSQIGIIGVLASGTTVLSVDSSTQITLSATPTTAGIATLTFTSPGNLSEISVSSIAGILIGSSVVKVSGDGVLSSNTTVSNINSITNVITLSSAPTQSGSIIISFIPPYGDPSTDFEYTINNLGEVESYSVTSGGNGYSLLDQLTINSSDLTQPIIYPVQNRSVQKITFTQTVSSSAISVGDFVKRKDGQIVAVDQTTVPTKSPAFVSNISTTLSDSSDIITVADTTGIISGMLVTTDQTSSVGVLASGTTVLSVDSSTQITLSATPIISGSAVLTFTSDEQGVYTDVSSTSSGDGSGATFDITRNSLGVITSITVNNSGNLYTQDDTITISGTNVGGSSPTHDIILTVSVVSSFPNLEVYKVNTSGGNISSIVIASGSLSDGNILIKSNTTSPDYEINVASSPENKYFIDTGSGYQITPNITLYSGNIYSFDISDSSNTSHLFSLSKYRDGIWAPSLISDISTTLLTTSNQITVSSATGILVGMAVTVSSGTGSLVTGTTVEEINGNIITLSSNPSVSGSVTLTFRGVEYTDNVIRSTTNLRIRVTNNTPTLYYYCANTSSGHENEGGDDNEEASLTIDTNNPKVFGSNLLFSVSSLSSDDVITGDIETGEFTAIKFIADDIEVDTASVSTSITVPTITTTSLNVSSIVSSSVLALNSPATNLSGNLNVGSSVQIVNSSGNITTSGVLKTTNSLNINDRLTITNNTISSATGNNIILSPPTGRVAKINTTSAITIPAGTTAQRPTSGVVESGSIRFNTDTGQYEGYSASTSSWSSLGGVRDLDGNTYIAAEASIGANDNTLYFYNDGNNTARISPTEFIFNTVKNISSPNPLNPVSTEWIANTPVTLGSYIFWNNNLYEVTTAGTTSTVGNEPTHTSGVQTNGTAQLTWYSNYSDDITFDKVLNVNINNNLVFNNELKLFDNKITTLLSDIIIEPFAGKKVDINTNTSLVLPNGTTAERGIPGQGSVRFNTSLSQFEGYNGVNWTSLGGVRDVDGNTYIIPETSPGSNENILYFFNDGDNTLRLSTNELIFDTIDQIGSVSNNLDLQASTVSFNSLSLTIDTSVSTDTTLLSTQDNFNIALSSGLTTDPLIRLTNTGDIYVNKTFGTGSNTLIKVLDNDLNKFELDDVITETSEYVLTKGTTENGASVIFNPTLHSGAKVIIIADNTSADDREMIEFTVIAKGTDIFHTEYGNVVSGDDIISPSFDFDAGGNVRLNSSLASGLTNGDVVNVTVVSTVIKK